MPGIGVVMNPHSRSNRRNPGRLKRLAFIVGDKGSCHATQDVFDLEQVASEFAAREVEILGISGGDGTVHHTISTFIQVYGSRPLPMIALLRGGTVNNVAGAVGVCGTPESVLSRLILKYHEGAPFVTTPVHCLDVNGKYGFLFGNGLAVNFIGEYIRLGEGGGPTVAWLITHSVCSAIVNSPYFLKLAPRYDATVTVDGTVWPFKNYTVINAGTVEPFGFGFAPFYRARERPSHFHILATSMLPRQILHSFGTIWAGRRLRSEHALDAIASRVEITLAEPAPYMIDGEFYPAVEKLTLRCGPALTMIRE